MLNKVILIGNLGADPDIRHLQSGGQVATVRLATTRKWKDKQTNQRKEDTEWHRVVFFNRLAEIAGEYLKKGSQIYVEGRITTRKWQAQDGQDRYSTEIVGEVMHMMGGKGENGSNRNSGGSTQNNPNSAPPPADQDGFDDYIPF